MYDVLFGENPNDTFLEEGSPEARHLPNNTALNDTSTPVADMVPLPERLICLSS